MSAANPPPLPDDVNRLLHDTEARFETRLRVLEEEKQELSAQLERRFEELGTLTRIMTDKEEDAAGREAELTRQLTHVQAALDNMENSTSWRITRPLRWLMSRVRRG